MTRSSSRLFFSVFLPAAVAVNLGLGVFILTTLGPASWLDWTVVGTGAFCCFVAGCLASAAWSRSYWAHAMARQVAVWRQIADAIFEWLEEVPVSPVALQRLKRSLDDTLIQTRLDRQTGGPVGQPVAGHGLPPTSI